MDDCSERSGKNPKGIREGRRSTRRSNILILLSMSLLVNCYGNGHSLSRLANCLRLPASSESTMNRAMDSFLSATGCNGFSSTVLSLSTGHPSSSPLGIHFRLTSLVQTMHQRSRTRCEDSSLPRERVRYHGHPRNSDFYTVIAIFFAADYRKQ